MSCSFANQTLAQVELFTNPDKYPVGVYVLPKALDEKVARIHAEALGAKITPLSEPQAEYLDVDLSGPFKAESYRY